MSPSVEEASRDDSRRRPPRESGGASAVADGPDRAGGTRLTRILDRFQQTNSWVGYPLAVIYKFVDDFGSYLAAVITYYAFVSLFPLLLLLTTVLGFLLAGDPELQQRILDSAMAQFPVVGDQLGDPKRLGGGVVGLVIGILLSAYGGLGVAQALQYATNTAWAVPKNRRPNPVKARLRSLSLVGTAGLAVLGTTVLSAIGTSGAGSFGVFLNVVALVAAVLINTGIFIAIFRLSTARDLSVRDVLPGAIVAAVAWQLLQTFGVAYVQRVIQGASATNGVFQLVLGLLAFLYLASAMVVMCIEINVVRVNHLHPRSLLSPFIDDVILTRADRRTYTEQAGAQRNKDFQTIDVTFDQTPPPEPEDRGAGES